MEKLVDANVILRYLLNDIPEQSEKAAEVIESGAFTLPEIIAEVVYVLLGVYKIPRSEIYDALKSLLEEVSIGSRAVVLKALEIFAEKNVDFVDCIIIARSKILGDTVVSFDKKLNALL